MWARYAGAGRQDETGVGPVFGKGRTMRHVVSIVMAIAIVFSVGWGVAGIGRTEAAGPTIDVWVQSVDGLGAQGVDEGVAGACLELAPYSNVGCDVNGDGYVWFEDIPSGTYTVIYHSVPAGYLRPMPRDVAVVAGVGTVLPIDIPVYRAVDGSADVSVLAVDDATGALLPGACFQLRGYSNVGCDVNGDGRVDFADIPYGEYVIDLIRAPVGTVLAYPEWEDRLYVDRDLPYAVESAIYFAVT